MNPQLTDGKPTGRIRDNLMEIELCIKHEGQIIPCGAHWIEITPERRKQIEDQRVVMSAGATAETEAVVAKSETADLLGLARSRQRTPPSKAEAHVTHFGPGTGSVIIAPEDIPGFIESFQTASIEDNRLRKEVREFTMTGISMTNDGPQVMGYGKIATDTKLSEQEAAAPEVKKQERKYVSAEELYTLGAKEVKPVYFPNGLIVDASGEILQLATKGHRPVNLPEYKISDASLKGEEKREGENSGGNVNYYSVEIKHPKRPDRKPYIFEVEDLIQALDLGFHEGTILKSLVRSATERVLGLKKMGNDSIRDAEKMLHSSGEELRARKIKRGLL
jgi:hypothetical protein